MQTIRTRTNVLLLNECHRMVKEIANTLSGVQLFFDKNEMKKHVITCYSVKKLLEIG